MKKRQLWRDSFRFSLSLQMVGMVLVISLAGMVLVRTWGGILTTARRTQALNQGVLLCRSAAELYTRDGDLAGTLAALGGQGEPGAKSAQLSYDRDMNLTEGESFLTLTLEEQPEAEGLHSCALTVTQDGRKLYSLTVETYVTEGS
jgi:type II secretory pathway pseudopilin PulG